MDNLKKSVGRRLRLLRAKRRLTREIVAGYAGIDPTNLYRIEKGQQWVGPEVLANLAIGFNVSPAVFFTDDIVVISPTPQEALEVLSNAVAGPRLVEDEGLKKFSAAWEKLDEPFKKGLIATIDAAIRAQEEFKKANTDKGSKKVKD